jgi:hypothetical protein
MTPNMPSKVKCLKKPSLALDTNIVQDNVPQMVLPGIFIGSIHAAFNQESLIENGITHILNASRVPATFPKNFTYLSIDIRDRDDANILACIPTSNIFLEAGIDAGGVLIHCFGGRSRSAAFVCAFLMSSRGWTLDHALEVVTAARPVAAINSGFDRQLRAYMETQYDVYASQQVLLRNRISSLQALRGNLPSPRGAKKDTFDSPAAAAIPAVPGTPLATGHKRTRSANSMIMEGNNGNMVIDAGREYEENDAEEAVAHITAPSTPQAEDGAAVIAKKSKNVGPAVPLLEGAAPNCRLSRPGSTTVRVIPPLRGLERHYGCVGCGRSLFALGNVVRSDVVLPTKRPASGASSDDGQFKVPLSSPKNSSRPNSQGSLGSNMHWARSEDDRERTIPQGGASAPIMIPLAPKSSRNAEKKSFGFDDMSTADNKQTSTAESDRAAGIEMDFSESPQEDKKLLVPPLRTLGLTNTARGRPQSAEKRRWLARVSLLKADSKESIHRHPDVPDAKSAKLAADDQSVVDVVERSVHPYFTIEYLGWMGAEPLGTKVDEGKLECPGCARHVGSWSWLEPAAIPKSGGSGNVGPPLFKAMRGSVQLADLPLDATPMSTPRPDPSPRDSMGDSMELDSAAYNVHK